jgi:hypothetical protein
MRGIWRVSGNMQQRGLYASMSCDTVRMPPKGPVVVRKIAEDGLAMYEHLKRV